MVDIFDPDGGWGAWLGAQGRLLLAPGSLQIAGPQLGGVGSIGAGWAWDAGGSEVIGISNNGRDKVGFEYSVPTGPGAIQGARLGLLIGTQGQQGGYINIGLQGESRLDPFRDGRLSILWGYVHEF